MTEIPSACYVPAGIGSHGGTTYASTRLAAAEWYPDGQHGGVVSALIARAVEATPTLVPMQIARLSVELFRVIPITPLELVVRVVREGKRIQTSAVRIYAGDVEVAIALVQRLRVTTLDFPPELSAPLPFAGPSPDGTRPFSEVMPLAPHGPVSFAQCAIEVCEIDGGFREPGAATVWFRLTKPLVQGQANSPTSTAIVAGDFSNGLSRLAHPDRWVFMNSDLTVHLARPPESEWIALAGSSRWESTGRGCASSELYDVTGPVGRATQTLFLDTTTLLTDRTHTGKG